MPSRPCTVEDLCRAGLVAIVRAASCDGVIDAGLAMCRGGVRAMEVTLNTPGALSAVAGLRAALSGATGGGGGAGAAPPMWVGAGTILGPADARAAVAAGAQFVVTPTVQAETLAFCNRICVPVFCGCLSPAEVLEASAAGADFIKVFPATAFGLPHLRALREAMPHLRLVPTGGVSARNLGEFFAAGCCAVAVGSSLVTGAILRGKDWPALEARARAMTAALDAARANVAAGAAPQRPPGLEV